MEFRHLTRPETSGRTARPALSRIVRVVRARSPAQASMELAWIARIYESRLWRRNPLIGLLQGISFEWESALVEGALRVSDDALVLDLGCGPGIYARPLAVRARNGLVVGAHLSPAMLRTATAHARRASLAASRSRLPPTQWRTGRARHCVASGANGHVRLRARRARIQAARSRLHGRAIACTRTGSGW